jgi:hypothetical protein
VRGGRAAVALVGVLAVAAFFRDFLLSGFDLIPGGRVDGRFLIAILEHWRDVVLHGAPMSSPPFFAPLPGMLGNSEAMILFAPPYIALRALGLGRYLAFAASLILAKTLGFITMYLALRRILSVDMFAATVGAALFTVSNAYWLAIGHAQLMTVVFLPGLALLVHRWVRARDSSALAAAALLLALMLFTSFYVGWFTMLMMGILCTILAVAASMGAWQWRPALRREDAIRVLRDALLALGVLVVAVLPLLSVYLPTLGATGGRPFEEVSLYLPPVSDLWNVGVLNRLWGGVLEWLHTRPPRYLFAHFEAERGWPPFTLATFLTTLAVALSRVRGGRADDARWARLAGIAGLTAVLGWLATIRIGEFTLWSWVYQLVPGATAIRVPVRLNLVLNVLVVAVVSLGLSRLGRRRPAGAVAAVLLAAAILAEQWNDFPPSGTSRAAERARFAALQPPPPGCRYFYLASRMAGRGNLERNLRLQVDAVLIAEKYRIPTINGYSGSMPRGWDLDAGVANYEERAWRWAAARGIDEGLCRLDLRSGVWSSVLARRNTPQ